MQWGPSAGDSCLTQHLGAARGLPAGDQRGFRGKSSHRECHTKTAKGSAACPSGTRSMADLEQRRIF